MRVVVLVLLALAFTGATVATMAPEASACTGDPSVCGVKRSVDCTRREGATTDALDCWGWV